MSFNHTEKQFLIYKLFDNPSLKIQIMILLKYLKIYVDILQI